MKQLLIIPLLTFILLGASISFAQDSLRLLATIVGERECASAGDVNGDGFMDIIAGSPCGRGYVKIYFGSSDFDTVADLKIIGEDEGPYGHYTSFGTTVACAGDVNKDGYDDVIVGATIAYNPNNGADWAGKAYIFFGGDPMDTTTDVILQDSDYFYFYGHSLSSAGDVNNDGYDDVIVGANLGWWCDGCGFAYIYFGGEDMDSVCDVYIQGGWAEQLGESVAGIGDVNSDGYDDVLIGSSKAGESWGTGKASIFFGGDPMDTIPDFTFWGDSIEFRNFGRNVASAGDVNGGAVPDILIGNTKKTRVFFGDSLLGTSSYVTLPVGYSISSAGDLNRDGYQDVIASDDKYPQSTYIFYGSSEMDGEADIILRAEDTTLAGFGIKVAGLNDINGDGYDEIMVSSSGDSLRQGIIFIYTSCPTSIQEPTDPKEKTSFDLHQNYPNPFNHSTLIRYSLNAKGRTIVTLRIYNILGQVVRTLVDTDQATGKYKVLWDGEDQSAGTVSSGIYFYQLKMGDLSAVKEMVFLK